MNKKRILSYCLLILTLLACKRYNPASDQIYQTPAEDNLSKKASLQIIEDAIDNNPEIAENHYKKAKILSQKKQDSLALISLQKALQLDSLNPKYNYLKATLNYQLQKSESAIKALLLGQSLQSNYLEGYLLGGQLYYDTKQYELAITQLNKALEINKNIPRTYYLKGKVALARYDSTNALRNLRLALNKKPDYYEVYESLAELYYLYEKYLSATRFVNRGLKIAPNNAPLNLLKARIYRARRYYPDSTLIYYQKAYALDASLHEAAYRLGKHYVEKANHKKARPYLVQAIKNKADFGQAHYYLGLCQKYVGENEEALGSFGKAIKYNPKNLAARDQYWAVKNRIEQKRLIAREDSIRKAYYERLRKMQEEQNNQ